MNGTADEKFLKELGKRIEKLRVKKNYSTREFANLVEIDPTTLWRIESGSSNPHITTIKAMAQVLDVSLDQICGLKPIPDIS